MGRGQTAGLSEDAAVLSRVMDSLREPVIRAAIEWLELPRNSRGLDIACGIGLEDIRLVQSIAPHGRVVGLDLSMPSLIAAKGHSKECAQAGDLDFLLGDWSKLPFAGDSFDWIWSCDAVGYAPYYQAHAIEEITRIVRPGGSVAILFSSSQSLLPGYPGLEARLNASQAGIAPFEEGMPPESHAMRGVGLLRSAGLERVRAMTFVHTVHSPLGDQALAALTALFKMRWGGSEVELDEAYRDAYQRLCLPDSPDFILDQQDYCAFFTYTMFTGRKPNKSFHSVFTNQ